MADQNTLSRRRPLHEDGNSVQRIGCDRSRRARRGLSSVLDYARPSNAYLSCVPLGPINDFPEGETRLATFRNPYVMPTDGQDRGDSVLGATRRRRAVPGFAINCCAPGLAPPCAGLHNPVCSCARVMAERTIATVRALRARRNAALFEYPYKVQDGYGLRFIARAELPTPGSPPRLFRGQAAVRCTERVGFHREQVARLRRSEFFAQKDKDMGGDRTNRAWFDQRLQLAAPIRDAAEHPVPPQHSELVLCVRQRCAHTVLFCKLVTGTLLALIYVPSASEAWSSLQALNHDVTLGWFIRAMHGWGLQLHGGNCPLIHMVQVFLFGAYKFPRELTGS